MERPRLEIVRPANAFERWGPPLMVFVLAIVVYLPSLNNWFVSWDDDHYIYDNRQLVHPDGLNDIWTNTKYTRFKKAGLKDSTHQYYPLLFTMFWIEHQVYHRLHDELLFELPAGELPGLEKRRLGKSLRRAFTEQEHALPKRARLFVVEPGRRWLIGVVPMNAKPKFYNAREGFGVRLEDGRLNVYSSDPAVFEYDPIFHRAAPEAWGFHAVSMVLHAVVAVVMIFFLRRLGVGVWMAWVVALLFAVHPMNVASVAWATELKNIFSLLFYMLAFICYLRHRRTGGWVAYGATLVLFQGALFSKTVALTFPVVLLMTDVLLVDRRLAWRSLAGSLLRIAPMIVMSAVAASLTMRMENRARTIPLVDHQRIFVAAGALWFYVLKLLVPLGQLPVYHLWNPNPLEPGRWMPAGEVFWWLPVLGVLVVAWLLIKQRRRVPPLLYWGLGFYVITQLPMLGLKNINIFQFAYVHDHYIYNGSLGVLLVFAIGLDALSRRLGDLRRGTLIVSALLCAAGVAYGAKTLVYSRVWKDSEAFWNTTLCGVNDPARWESPGTFWGPDFRGNPGCWAGWYNLWNQYNREASACIERGDTAGANRMFDRAIEYYKGYIRAKPDRLPAYRILVDRLLRQQRYDEAEEYCTKAESRKPFFAHYYRGRIRAKQKKLDEALQYYEKALQCRSTRSERIELSQRTMSCMLKLHKYDEVVRLGAQVLKLRPRGDYLTHYYLGTAYYNLEQLDQAERHFRRALELNPKDARARQFLGLIKQQRSSTP